MLRVSIGLAALISVLFAMLVLWGAGVSAGTITGREIMEKVNRRSRGVTVRMLLEMTLRDSRQKIFHKRIVMERKKFGSAYRSAYWITAPDHEKRIALLLAEDRTPPGMWMYFPSNDQVTNIASRGFPAMASDFSCEDLLQQIPLASYDFKVLGRGAERGVHVTRVEMIPGTDRLKSELGFSRSVGWVREDIGMIVKADYYDEKGSIFKKFSTDEIEKVHGVWTAHRLVMENLRAEHGTEVRVLSEDYLRTFADDVFSPDALGRDFALATADPE